MKPMRGMPHERPETLDSESEDPAKDGLLLAQSGHRCGRSHHQRHHRLEEARAGRVAAVRCVHDDVMPI